MNNLLEKLNISDHVYGSVKTAKVVVGAWTIETLQDIDESRTYYSKAWHRRYGPKYTVSNRRVRFSRKHGKNSGIRRDDGIFCGCLPVD